MLQKIALAPTGRILFFSRYPAMLGVRFGTYVLVRLFSIS